MRRPVKRVLGVTTLLAVALSSAAGWAVALHQIGDDHHGKDSTHHGVVGLDIALHGHAHGDGTPSHGHPFLTTVAAPVPGKLLLTVPVLIGDGHELVAAPTSGWHPLLPGGPTHDLPPRRQDVSVLRI